MGEKMLWRNLLNGNRRRPSFIDPKDHRNEFEKDYDRIVSSSSLRRLQDKAQVFPLQATDFTRTRLTHSIEVSAIARSFGNWLEKWLLAKGKISMKEIGQIPSMLAVAGLVHDIGNPPFGHYGEDVIKQWFSNWFSSHEFIKLEEEQYISEEEKQDFLNFDGNAQGLRILARLQFLNDEYGINFTYGTLSVLMKYPWASSEVEKDEQKFGFFQKDLSIATEVIQNTTKMDNVKHPLTYLLEAADDIAYLAADVEDGVKKSEIPWNQEFNNLTKVLGNHYDLSNLIKRHKEAKEKQFPDQNLTSAQNFRVWAQGQMMREVMGVFDQYYQEIMNGTFKGELLKKTEKARFIKEELKRLVSQYCYPSKEVLSLELLGDSILYDLLTKFVTAIVHDKGLNKEDGEINTKSREGKLLTLISDNFRYVHLLGDSGNNKKTLKNLTLYDKLLLITDFISGMTDSYALDLHQKINGVKMP